MRQDENGDLWFVSRKKHLIIRGGSNISPVEVERVLMAHPAVRDAAVVGVSDPDLGQSAERRPQRYSRLCYQATGRLQSSRDPRDHR
jgi:hypothetical protein